MVKSSVADYNNALADDGNRQISGVVDDSAWRIMKKVSPKYAFYDSFD
jgi:CelD/BcsL family acetyltransferase involved in cellulose biosynthesis